MIAERYGYDDILEHLDLVVNAQQMLSLRLDIIDYESGFSSTRPKENISPWPKVEKVLRSFTGKMRARRIKWRFQGRTRDIVVGTPVFESIPFVMVENALKSASTGWGVLVTFEEKTAEIWINIYSISQVIK